MFSCSYTVLKSNSFFKIESLSLRLTRSPEWWRHLRRSQLAISTLRPIRLLIPVIPIRIDRYNCKNVSLALFFVWASDSIWPTRLAHPSECLIFRDACLDFDFGDETEIQSTWALKGQSRGWWGFQMRERLLSWHRLFVWHHTLIPPK